MKKAFILQLLLICSLFAADRPEKEIVIIIPSYNNAHWAENNINSIVQQKYKNFRIIYINDASQDKTNKTVEKLVKNLSDRPFQSLYFSKKEGEELDETINRFKKRVNYKKSFFTLVNNTKRCGALENIYRAVYSCEDHEIIAIVDGDDWLAHPYVLETLNQLYSTQDIWMTHGRLIEYPNQGTHWCEPIPPELIASNSIRHFKCPSHLRTFYCWLFKKIALKDLQLDGKFFPMTGDMAVMFPITEMAGKHQFFINEINYVYNVESPLNDNKVNQRLQRDLDYYIRSLPPYEPITAPDIESPRTNEMKSIEK